MKKVSASFKLSLQSRQILAVLAKREGLDKTTVLEIAIRELARIRDIDYTCDLSNESGIKY